METTISKSKILYFTHIVRESHARRYILRAVSAGLAIIIVRIINCEEKSQQVKGNTLMKHEYQTYENAPAYRFSLLILIQFCNE